MYSYANARLSIGIGVFTVGIYAFIAQRSYIAPIYRFNGSGLVFLGSLLCLAAILLWRKSDIRRVEWFIPAILILLALVSFPGTSRDYLRYLFDGEMIRLWHLSPYIHLPPEFPVDKYVVAFHHIWWTRIPSPYGPLWQAVMVVVNLVTANNMIAGVITLKIMNLLALLMCSRYIYLITGKISASFLFLINPIILLDTVATPHTDIFIALGILAALRHKNWAARGALIGAIGLIKLPALILLPFFRRGGRNLWLTSLSTLITLGISLAILMPLLGFDLTSMLRASQSGALSATDSLLMRSLMPWASSTTIVSASFGIFTIFYVGVLLAFWRRSISPIDALILVSFLVPLCLTGLLLPWHFIIPLSLLLLSERPVAIWTVMFLTLVALRSATTVVEMLFLAMLLAAGGWIVYVATKKLSNPPAFATHLIKLFE
jgi:hypothetical protein